MCGACWYEQNRDGEPVRVKNDSPQVCCFCGNRTSAGIYVRHDPAELECKHDD